MIEIYLEAQFVRPMLMQLCLTDISEDITLWVEDATECQGIVKEYSKLQHISDDAFPKVNLRTLLEPEKISNLIILANNPDIQKKGYALEAKRMVVMLKEDGDAMGANIEELHRLCPEMVIDVVNAGKAQKEMAITLLVKAITEKKNPGIYCASIPQSLFYVGEDIFPVHPLIASLRNVHQLKECYAYANESKDFLKNYRLNKGVPVPVFLDEISKYEKEIENVFRLSKSFADSFSETEMRKRLKTKSKKMPDGQTATQYTTAAHNTIFEVAMSFHNIMEETDVTEQMVSLGLTPYIGKELVNPFSAIAIGRRAFEVKEKWASAIRSQVLDIWEDLFNQKQNYQVEEIVIGRDEEEWKKYKDFLNSDDFENNKVLCLLLQDNNRVAICSPYTGFVPLERISTGRHEELSTRSFEFKRFMYKYVFTIKNFSKAFVDYVTEQCSSEVISSEDLFKAYPRLGRHIPIY